MELIEVKIDNNPEVKIGNNLKIQRKYSLFMTEEEMNYIKETLEMRIPKRPNHNRGSSFYICPNCNKLIRKNEQAHGKIDIPHCKWCGQAIDWSDINGPANDMVENLSEP